MIQNITELNSWYKNKAGIYKLSIGGHIYIGSSVSLWSRLKQHRTDLKCGRHQNQYMQRAVNKYGFENLQYEVLILFHNIKLKTLRTFEKEYIEYFNADLNLKKDPTTENNCITCSKVVYQYDTLGNLLRKWDSCNEAARSLKVHSSNINICCSHPQRQHLCAGSLWSYENPYPHMNFIHPIYCFDLKGNYIGEYGSTVDIATSFFSDTKRKTILSQLKKKIDSGIPYKNIYLSHNRDFSIDQKYKPRYNENRALETILSGNPIVYIYGKKNNLIDEKRLLDFDNPVYIKHKIRANCNKYRLVKGEYYDLKRRFNIVALNLITGEESVFNTAVFAAEVLFGDRKLGKNILKHINRGTNYKNYSFKRALYKTP